MEQLSFKIKKWKAVLFGVLFVVSFWLAKADYSYAASVPSISYKGHVQGYGWQSTVKDGKTAGTENQSKRLEGLIINLKDSKGKSMVSYCAHVSNIGWQGWKSSGQLAGTTGQSRRIEALKIKLTGSYASQYDIYYRVHVEKVGWLGWAKNGEMAGSEGLSMRVEAVQIKLVKRGAAVQRGGSASLSRPKLTYKVHCQSDGWKGEVKEGVTAGTTGQSKRLEGLIVNLKDYFGYSGVYYLVHVSGQGWQDWKGSGQLAGTTGQAKAIEAVQIKLSDSLKDYFDIYYQVHVAGRGWLGWAKNGAPAGTVGGGVRAEAIRIKLVSKGDTSIKTGGPAYYDLTPVSKEDSRREAVVKYMKDMAQIAWTPSKSFVHWSGSKNGPGTWKAGTTYYGIPYSQSTRGTDLNGFKASLKGFKYVGPSGQKTYKGSDCSSAVSMAWRLVNSKIPLKATSSMFPGNSYIKKVGNYSVTSNNNTVRICQNNGSGKMYQAYAMLKKGDAVVTHRSGGEQHVMLVTDVNSSARTIKVTHQTTYNKNKRSTWRVDETWSFSTLYAKGYIPITLSTW